MRMTARLGEAPEVEMGRAVGRASRDREAAGSRAAVHGPQRRSAHQSRTVLACTRLELFKEAKGRMKRAFLKSGAGNQK